MPSAEFDRATSARFAAETIEFGTSGFPLAIDVLASGGTVLFAAACRPPMNAVRNAKIERSARTAICGQESAAA